MAKMRFNMFIWALNRLKRYNYVVLFETLLPKSVVFTTFIKAVYNKKGMTN